MDENSFNPPEESQSETPQEPVTVEALDKLCQEMFDQREKIRSMDDALSVENKKLSAMQSKALAYLVELDREKYQSPTGTISVKDEWRFRLPETLEEKLQFFEHLKERGMFDQYATVNANSYNSYLNKEWEIAREEGRGMEFKVPGVPEPTFFRKLNMLAKRG